MGKLTYLFLILAVLGCVHSTDDNGYDCSTPEEDIDVCKDYHIMNEAWRHVGNSGGDNCDAQLIIGWYRFFVNASSAQIPTVCIKNSACGTTIPMRVELEARALPDEGCTMEATACGSYVILGKWDCCVLRQKILIHNCGDFYVYKLTPPDRCQMAYCSQVPDDEFEHLTAKTGESAEIVTPTTNFEETSTEDTQSVENMTSNDENDEILPDTTTISAAIQATPVCSQACSLSMPADSTTSAPCRLCDNGQCFPDHFWCDGIPDCSDNSDEENCITMVMPCPEGLKRCPDRSCVTQEIPCPTESDEADPTSTIPTYTYTFPLFTLGTTASTTERQDTSLLTSIEPSSQFITGIMPSHSDVTDVLSSQSQVVVGSSLTEKQNQTQIVASETLGRNQTTSLNSNTGMFSAVTSPTDIIPNVSRSTRDQTVSQSNAQGFSSSIGGIFPTSAPSSESTFVILVSPSDSYVDVESKSLSDGIIATSSSVFPTETIFPTTVTQSSFTGAPVSSQSVEMQISTAATTSSISATSSSEDRMLSSLTASSTMSERTQFNSLSTDFISKSSDILLISSVTSSVHYISTSTESYDISGTQTSLDHHEIVKPTKSVVNTPEYSISPSTDTRSDLTTSVNFVTMATISLSGSSAITLTESSEITTDTSGYATKTVSELHTSIIPASPKASDLHMQTLTYDSRTTTQMEKEVSTMPNVTTSVVPSTHRSTTTTEEPHITSNKVLLIFRLGFIFRNALHLFRIRLQAALVMTMNRFYHARRRIGRDTNNLTNFVMEDVHILDIELTSDNLTAVQIAIDKPGNHSDELIPGTDLSKLLLRDEVWQFLLDQLMDPDAKLIEVVPVDSELTSTYGGITMTLTPKLNDDEDKFDIKELFFAHFGLFVSIIVIISVCIICILTALLYLRTKGKRGSWTCKTKDYYKKCEKTLLMHKNRSPGQVESPLTDVEIMNDEEQMVEKVPLTPDETVVNGNDTSTQNSESNTENDKYFDEKGWIIPVNEVLVENGQRILISQEDTKL